MSPKHSPSVRSEQFPIVEYNGYVVSYRSYPKTKVWAVKRKTDHNKPFRTWMPLSMGDEIKKIYPGISNFEMTSPGGGFLYGQHMIKLATLIQTCGTDRGRPKTLYRLTYDEQPHEGKKPRGHGLVTVDPLSFHIFLQKHLDWRCRNPSPFLSATSDPRKVREVHENYKKRGFQGIKLIRFRTSGPGWDHAKQKLYHVPDLYRRLGDSIPYQPFMRHEYLLQGEIPAASIIKEFSLASGNPRREKRKPEPPRKGPNDDWSARGKRAKGFRLRI